MYKRIGWSLVLLLVLSGAVGYRYYQAHYTLRQVSTIPVVRGRIESFVSISGRVVNDRTVTLSALVDGEIRALNVNVGDKVRKGQWLVSFDDQESRHLIRRAKAEQTLQQQSLQQARQRLERLQTLRRKGVITPEQLEQAQSEVVLAQSRLAIATESLAIEQYRSRKTRLYAPYAGVITEKFVDAGQWTASGTPLLVLAADKGREIEALVDAGDFAAIQTGKAVTVSADAYPDKRWSEHIRRMAPAISSGKDSRSINTFPVRISLSATAPPLLLNQQVDIHLSVEAKAQALMIPLSALQETDGRHEVLLADKGYVRRVAVTTGIESYTHVEILQGLAEGQRLILPQGQSFAEGERIRTESP